MGEDTLLAHYVADEHQRLASDAGQGIGLRQSLYQAVRLPLPHAVLLLVMCLAILADEVILDGNVKVPRVLRVWYACEHPCAQSAQ